MQNRIPIMPLDQLEELCGYGPLVSPVDPKNVGLVCLCSIKCFHAGQILVVLGSFCKIIFLKIVNSFITKEEKLRNTA